jgi:trehalose utilization protein
MMSSDHTLPSRRDVSRAIVSGLALGFATAGRAEEKADPAPGKPVRVVIWDERQPEQKQVYPDFLGNYLAEYLKGKPGLEVRSVSLGDPEQGIGDAVLDGCDVLVWWGHKRQAEVAEPAARKVVDRIVAGRLSLVVLHSAHWATPFVLAMHERAAADAVAALPAGKRAGAQVVFAGKLERRPPKPGDALTPAVKATEKQPDGTTRLTLARPNCCFPRYNAYAKPSTLTVLLPDHPVAKGVPATVRLPMTEMYDEPFHVPAPDAVILEEKWEDGSRFRSGALWTVGKGRVFYFRPGHETYPVFKEEAVQRIMENAVRWMGQAKG